MSSCVSTRTSHGDDRGAWTAMRVSADPPLRAVQKACTGNRGLLYESNGQMLVRFCDTEGAEMRQAVDAQAGPDPEALLSRSGSRNPARGARASINGRTPRSGRLMVAAPMQLE